MISHKEQEVEDFFTWVEEFASFHQVTCDYILEEFILNKKPND